MPRMKPWPPPARSGPPRPRSSVRDHRPPPKAATGTPGAFPGPFRFTVPCDPVPKARPRVTNGHTYTPDRTIAAEALVRAAARKAGVTPLSGPVRVELRFWRQTARPCDIDNLAKLVLDALNGGVAYADDSQVISLEAHKGLDRQNPRTEVLIERVPTEAVPVEAWESAWEGTP